MNLKKTEKICASSVRFNKPKNKSVEKNDKWN